MSEKDFEMLKKIGEGSFGQVYKVKRISDRTEYAMKKVKILDMKQRDKNNALNQIRLLASLEHQNIVAYKQAFYDSQTHKLCTVMELAENGDLSCLIKNKYRNFEGFCEFQIWPIGRGILKGLQALHDNKIVHRDLKPANIFFGKNNVPKIGDMNVSILLNNDLAYTQTGTPYYASPQVWNNDPYSFQCDIWSFGCILYEMCTSKPPFKGKDMDALYQKIQQCQYDKIPKKYSPQIQEVISLCLRPKNQRAKVSQVLKYFQKCQPPKPSLRLLVKKSKTTHNLLRTIKMPMDKKQLAKLLPKSKYRVEEQSTSNQGDPQIMRQSSTSLGKRQNSQRKNEVQQNESGKVSIDNSSIKRPSLVLGPVSGKSLKRLEKNPGTRKLLDLFSPKNQPYTHLDLDRPRSYLLNLPSIKSEKYLKRQRVCLKDQRQGSHLKDQKQRGHIKNQIQEVHIKDQRQRGYLKDHVSSNQYPSYKNILQSTKITNVEKLSMERLNLKRRKLRMALNC